MTDPQPFYCPDCGHTADIPVRELAPGVIECPQPRCSLHQIPIHMAHGQPRTDTKASRRAITASE